MSIVPIFVNLFVMIELISMVHNRGCKTFANLYLWMFLPVSAFLCQYEFYLLQTLTLLVFTYVMLVIAKFI